MSPSNAEQQRESPSLFSYDIVNLFKDSELDSKFSRMMSTNFDEGELRKKYPTLHNSIRPIKLMEDILLSYFGRNIPTIYVTFEKRGEKFKFFMLTSRSFYDKYNFRPETRSSLFIRDRRFLPHFNVMVPYEKNKSIYLGDYCPIKGHPYTEWNGENASFQHDSSSKLLKMLREPSEEPIG
jgi:hypothetical protein